jgi:hypothetical protein
MSQVRKAGDFKCSSCNALYSTVMHRLDRRARDKAVCDDCKTIMCDWNSTSRPIFTLKQHGDGTPA